MTYIPNCRTDEFYNQKYLNHDDALEVFGYDWAAYTMGSFTWNMDVFRDDFDIEGVDINLARFVENHDDVAKALECAIGRWLEMNRDEMIVSMLEDMRDADFNNRKAEVDADPSKGARIFDFGGDD